MCSITSAHLIQNFNFQLMAKDSDNLIFSPLSFHAVVAMAASMGSDTHLNFLEGELDKGATAFLEREYRQLLEGYQV